MSALVLYNAQRREVVIGDEAARGGEAAVFYLPQRRDWFAKVYKVRRDGYDAKLGWMVANPPAEPNATLGHASIAWPHEVLFDGHGQCVGYLMPRIDEAYKLLEVFNPRLRAQTLPAFGWRHLHRTARNLASALNSLHESRYVVGDLNESNVLVKGNALVTIIDADSFQVRTDKRLFLCPVARPEYLPPELHGRPLGTTERTPEHDAFGLAVLIYQLLMDGSHPFRAQWLGPGDPPDMAERIRQGLFPYASGSRGRVAPPPATLPLEALDPQLQMLVRRCFVDGHQSPSARPAALAWKDALEAAENSLKRCPQGHTYAGHLSECAWCALQETQRRAAQRAAGAGRVRATRAKQRTATGSSVPFGQSGTAGAGGTASGPGGSSGTWTVPPPPFTRTRRRRSRKRTAGGSGRSVIDWLVLLSNVYRQGSGGARQTFFNLPDLVRWALALTGRAFVAGFRSFRFVFVAPNWNAFNRAAAAIAAGAIALGLIWAIIGAGVGALALSLAGIAMSDALLRADVQTALATYALWGAVGAGPPALALGAMLMGASRYRDAGGAWVGVLSAGALVPLLRALTLPQALAVGAGAGALFGLAALLVAQVPARDGFPFAWAATRMLRTRFVRAADWRSLLSAALWGLGVAALVKWTLPLLPLAVLIAITQGYLGGIAVAMKKP